MDVNPKPRETPFPFSPASAGPKLARNPSSADLGERAPRCTFLEQSLGGACAPSAITSPPEMATGCDL